MSDKKKDIDIEILSNIDDEIVERNTRKRFTLFRNMIARKRKRKILTVTLSSAASFLLICGILLSVLIPMLAGNVPVYRGMTVSTESPLATQTNKVSLMPEFKPINMSATQSVLMNPYYLSSSTAAGQKDKEEKPKKDGEIVDEIEDTLNIVGGAETIYYAEPEGDIYITVHIDNPDDYEILSFTLNGAKYSAYMFEEGSDMENLVLKVNVGKTEGVLEYTIDAIKYVKGEKIKDVRMEGDKTVMVGVKTEKQPAVRISNTKTSFKNISFNANVTDELRLIELSGGRVDAVLYEGNTLVATQPITVGTDATVEFRDLRPGITYTCIITASYDALDGKGFGTYILAKNYVFTQAVLSFEDVVVTKEGVYYKLTWEEGQTEREISSIVLYQGETRVCDIAKEATSVEGLFSDKKYRIVVEYKYNGGTEIVELSFDTPEKEMPTIDVADVVTKLHAIEFNVAEKDADDVAKITKVELFKENTLIKSSDNLSAVSFDGLESDTLYTVVITYEYDLNKGGGLKTKEKKVDIKTKYDFGVGEWTVSQGLEYSEDGKKIVGKGTCTDEILFLDAERIASNAFEGDKKIKAIYISPNVKVIENYAFSKCKQLETVGMADTERLSIWSHVFAECEALKSVRLPSSGRVSIATMAFYGCHSLTSIELPDGLRSIGESTFEGTSLQSIIIPDGVTKIRSYAFAGCPLESVNIPDSVTSIGEGAFGGVKEVFIPDSVTTIGAYAFGGWVKIYCEAASEPEGWDANWCGGDTTNVTWGYTKE